MTKRKSTWQSARRLPRLALASRFTHLRCVWYWLSVLNSRKPDERLPFSRSTSFVRRHRAPRCSALDGEARSPPRDFRRKRLLHFTRSQTSVLTLSLPLIGLMIGGVLIVS